MPHDDVMAGRWGAPEWLITLGGGFFIFALAVAALFVPGIRWPHLAQGSIYVFTIVAALRRGGFGILALAFVGTTAFLIAATALLAPDYLVAFTRALHPHWPWQRS